ncbi:MAG: uroporphyrinogen decarboxylase family protein, partial [Spirochaetota bacterium]
GILGYDLIDLDSMVDPVKARGDAGPGQVFSGNLDPVRILRDGGVDTVRDSLGICEKALASGLEDRRPWIVGAGCEIPRNTPRANITAMRDFARARG